MSNIYPQEIQNILEDLNNGTTDWTDVYQQLPRRDRELTEALCYSHTADFIVMHGSDVFLFISDEQEGTWEVQHLGAPIYYVEPEMISGDDSVDFDDFLKELQYELPGVTVERGSALSNASSEFVNQFKTKLETAFQTALDNL